MLINTTHKLNTYLCWHWPSTVEVKRFSHEGVCPWRCIGGKMKTESSTSMQMQLGYMGLSKGKRWLSIQTSWLVLQISGLEWVYLQIHTAKLLAGSECTQCWFSHPHTRCVPITHTHKHMHIVHTHTYWHTGTCTHTHTHTYWHTGTCTHTHTHTHTYWHTGTCTHTHTHTLTSLIHRDHTKRAF